MVSTPASYSGVHIIAGGSAAMTRVSRGFPKSLLIKPVYYPKLDQTVSFHILSSSLIIPLLEAK
jgi:hypothetical protein